MIAMLSITVFTKTTYKLCKSRSVVKKWKFIETIRLFMPKDINDKVIVENKQQQYFYNVIFNSMWR